jgi:hypothetical protein
MTLLDVLYYGFSLAPRPSLYAPGAQRYGGPAAR